MTSRKQFWLAILLLGMVVASPWLWREGRNLWLGWQWWQAKADSNDLLRARLLWPAQWACSSRDPGRRDRGLHALALAEGRGIVSKEELASGYLKALWRSPKAEDTTLLKTEDWESIHNTLSNLRACDLDILNLHGEMFLDVVEDKRIVSAVRLELAGSLLKATQSESPRSGDVERRLLADMEVFLGDLDPRVRLNALQAVLNYRHAYPSGIWVRAMNVAAGLSAGDDKEIRDQARRQMSFWLATDWCTAKEGYGTESDQARWREALVKGDR